MSAKHTFWMNFSKDWTTCLWNLIALMARLVMAFILDFEMDDFISFRDNNYKTQNQIST